MFFSKVSFRKEEDEVLSCPNHIFIIRNTAQYVKRLDNFFQLFLVENKDLAKKTLNFQYLTSFSLEKYNLKSRLSQKNYLQSEPPMNLIFSLHALILKGVTA